MFFSNIKMISTTYISFGFSSFKFSSISKQTGRESSIDLQLPFNLHWWCHHNAAVLFLAMKCSYEVTVHQNRRTMKQATFSIWKQSVRRSNKPSVFSAIIFCSQWKNHHTLFFVRIGVFFMASRLQQNVILAIYV